MKGVLHTAASAEIGVASAGAMTRISAEAKRAPRRVTRARTWESTSGRMLAESEGPASPGRDIERRGSLVVVGFGEGLEATVPAIEA